MKKKEEPVRLTINFLSNKIGWFGKYSGYECLTDYFDSGATAVVNTAQYNLYNKVVGKFYKVKNRLHHRSEDILNEVRFLRKIGSTDISHVLYLESHLDLLATIADTSKLVGTIHLPVSQWSENKLKALAHLKNVFILYNEEVEVFSKYIPLQNIHVIRHGVDVDFFKPGNPALVKKNKVLFVGHFLRDFDMMKTVVDKISASIKDTIEYHFIIPSLFRTHPVLIEFSQRRNVFFHEKLSDEELLQQYQTSYVLLMPMLDSGANTAMVQALSVGLPVITNNVGGIQTYGGGDVFPVAGSTDCDGMVDIFKQHYFDSDFQKTISNNQRTFSTSYLDWRLIAKQHVAAYQRVNQMVADHTLVS